MDSFNFDEYTIKLATAKDIDEYYRAGFINPDQAVDYFTGSKGTYTYEVIKNYLLKNEKDKTRYDFIIWKDDKIIGEVVINDIIHSKGHYRIAIFSSEYFGKGIGFKSSKLVIDYMFHSIGLEEISLEVYPFNKRGIKLYKKLGFVEQGIFNDFDREQPYDKYILMKLKNSKMD